jgi:hypothetical protein
VPQVKKAHCPAPGAVAAASLSYWAATPPQTPAKAGAVLIAEGIGLLAEAGQDAPKLIEACRRKYPRFADAISTHIPAAAREQARHLKRAHGFASLQDLYLVALLKSLIRRGFLDPDLEPAAAPERC